MGFFSELKKDLSTAVDEIGAEEGTAAEKNSGQEHAEVEEVDLDSMLNHLDQIQVKESPEPEVQQNSSDKPEAVKEEKLEVKETKETKENPLAEAPLNDFSGGISMDFGPKFESVANELEKENAKDLPLEKAESPFRRFEPETEIPEQPASQNNTYEDGGYVMMDAEHVATDETASITEGMIVNGDIQTTGSLDLIGKVIGNVTAYGKLNITGEVEGNSNASEIFAEAARINGDVHSQGSIKLGQSSVIIGNIFATSAVIAGAVKGDIDVHGPVVLDTTAIVMGNIKSQSVQINNGAVIEGMCSQTYAEVNPTAFFEGLKNKA